MRFASLKVLQSRRALVALGLIVALGTVSGGAVAAIAISGDGERPDPTGVINYADVSGEYSVLADGTQSDERPITDPLVVQSIIPLQGPWPAPAGVPVAYLSVAGDETWMAIRDAGEERLVAQMRAPGDPELIAGLKGEARTANGIPLVAAWSPDGEMLAFGSATGFPFTLNIAAVDSVSPETHEVGNDYVGEAVWSPDGQYLAVSSYSIDRSHHTVFIWDRKTSDLSQLIDGCHIIWSPDSNYLVLHRDPYDQPGVSVVSIDGEYVHNLTNDPNGFPSAWVE